MTTRWRGQIAGSFHGYECGRVFELSDGSLWRQESRTSESVYREWPGARLLDDGMGQTYLDVEGTSAVVRVVPESAQGPSRAGVF
jgi:hypothetical protein